MIWNRGRCVGGPYTGMVIISADMMTMVATDMDDPLRRTIPGLQAENKKHRNIAWSHYEFVNDSWIWHERHPNL